MWIIRGTWLKPWWSITLSFLPVTIDCGEETANQIPPPRGRGINFLVNRSFPPLTISTTQRHPSAAGVFDYAPIWGNNRQGGVRSLLRVLALWQKAARGHRGPSCKTYCASSIRGLKPPAILGGSLPRSRGLLDLSVPP